MMAGRNKDQDPVQKGEYGTKGGVNELLEMIFSSIHTCIAYLDRNLNFIWVNRAYAALFEREAGFFAGKPYFDLFPDPVMEAVFRKVVKTGGTYAAFSKPLSPKDLPDREVTFWDWRLQSVTDGGTKVTGALLILENVTQREETERALRESQTMFEHLFESAPDANILVDASGRIAAMNRQTEELFGYTRAELVGKTIEILLPERFQAGHTRHRSVYTRDPHIRPMGFGLELFGMRKDGREFPVDVTLSPLRKETGLLVLAVVRDITLRKTVEEALRASEERFKVALKNSPITVFHQDESLKYTWIHNSSSWLPDGDLLGKTDFDLFKPDLAAYLTEVKTRVVNSGNGERIEFAVPVEGKEQVYDLTIEPLRDLGGKTIGITCAAVHITERKRSEQALRESEAKLQAVMSNLPVILWVVDREWNFTLMQGKGLSTIGMKPGQFVGESIYKILADRRDVQEYIERAMSGEEVLLDVDTNAGQVFETIYSPLTDSNGQVTGVIGLSTNVTERKQAELELKHSEDRFRTSVENMQDGFAILSAVRDETGQIVDFTFEYANQAAVEANQIIPDAVIGKRLLEGQPQLKTGLFEEFCRLVETGTPVVKESFEYESTQDGLPGKRAYDIQATRLGDGFTVSWRDVTEHRQMQLALQQQEALLRTVLDTLPVGVWAANEDGTIVLGNQAGQKIWGDRYSPLTSPYGFSRSWWRKSGRRIAPEEWPMLRAVKWGETILEEELDIEPAGGMRKTILCSAVPLRVGQEKITGAIMVTQEITERKQMEMELAEVQRRLMDGIESERRRLAQELHDGPIQDLYGIEYHLKAMSTDPQADPLKPGLADTDAAVQDVIHVLRDLCGDLRPPALVHFGLRRAILSHIEKFMLEHPEINVDLDLVNDHDRLPEPIRMALFRIYQNTLSNIARHARASQVRIHYGLSEHLAVLEISDNGVGFRLPRKVELAREGHLGLIGSSERAESVGGHLTVETRPGAGTTIRAEVPVLPNRAIPAEQASEAA